MPELDLNAHVPAKDRENPTVSATRTVVIPSGSTATITVPMPGGVKSCKYYCDDAIWIASTEAGLTPSVISASPDIQEYQAVPEFGSKRGGALIQETEFSNVYIKPISAPSTDVTVYLIAGKY